MIDLREHGIGVSSSNIKSIQRGIVSNSSFTALTINISKVNLNSSIVRLVDPPHVAEDGYGAFKIDFVNDSQISLERCSQPASFELCWEVIEFNNVKSMQRGTTIFSNDSLTELSVVISTINIGKSLIVSSFKRSDTTFSASIRGRMIDETHIGFKSRTSCASNNATVAWQVIEFK